MEASVIVACSLADTVGEACTMSCPCTWPAWTQGYRLLLRRGHCDGTALLDLSYPRARLGTTKSTMYASLAMMLRFQSSRRTDCARLGAVQNVGEVQCIRGGTNCSPGAQVLYLVRAL